VVVAAGIALATGAIVAVGITGAAVAGMAVGVADAQADRTSINTSMVEKTSLFFMTCHL
jgi:hypothetical protein